MLMEVLIVYLNASNASKGKAYSLFTSSSECVRRDRLRHNIALILLNSCLTINCESPQSPVNYIKWEFFVPAVVLFCLSPSTRCFFELRGSITKELQTVII